MAEFNRERRLTCRFLTLPYRLQVDVANSIGFPSETDRALSAEDFLDMFRWAYENGLLAKLWDEVESRHEDPAKRNPFE